MPRKIRPRANGRSKSASRESTRIPVLQPVAAVDFDQKENFTAQTFHAKPLFAPPTVLHKQSLKRIAFLSFENFPIILNRGGLGI